MVPTDALAPPAADGEAGGGGDGGGDGGGGDGGGGEGGATPQNSKVLRPEQLTAAPFSYRLAHPESPPFRLPCPHAEPGRAELSPFTSPVPAIHRPSSVEKPEPLFDPVHRRLF